MTTRLEQAIADKSAVVGVVGLGYVGLPLDSRLRGRRLPHHGLRRRQGQGGQAAGRPKLHRAHLERVDHRVHRDEEVSAHGRHEATGRGRLPADLRAHAAVGQPRPGSGLRRSDRAADRRGAASRATGGARKHDLSRHHARRGAADSGRARLEAGDRLFLAYSPEREDPGNPNYTASGIPKVVGGMEPTSARLAEALYSHGRGERRAGHRAAKWPRPARFWKTPIAR